MIKMLQLHICSDEFRFNHNLLEAWFLFNADWMVGQFSRYWRFQDCFRIQTSAFQRVSNVSVAVASVAYHFAEAVMIVNLKQEIKSDVYAKQQLMLQLQWFQLRSKASRLKQLRETPCQWVAVSLLSFLNTLGSDRCP